RAQTLSGQQVDTMGVGTRCDQVSDAVAVEVFDGDWPNRRSGAYRIRSQGCKSAIAVTRQYGDGVRDANDGIRNSIPSYVCNRHAPGAKSERQSAANRRLKGPIAFAKQYSKNSAIVICAIDGHDVELAVPVHICDCQARGGRCARW